MVTHAKYMKFKFRCPQIKFYWNVAVHLLLSVAVQHNGQSGMVMTDPAALEKKMFTIWRFAEKV